MKLGSKSPVASAKAKAIKSADEKLDEEMSPEMLAQDIASDKAMLAKKKKSPMAAHKQQIDAMQYRAKSPNPMGAGGRMRASDIKTGARKVGSAY